MAEDSSPLRLISDSEPTDNEILVFIGKAVTPWKEITSFLKENYDFLPEKKNYGKKWGWVIRYRKSGKTWCALYPENDCFSVQIILGKNESEKFEEQKNEFSKFVVEKFTNTNQLHDGRWLFFTITDSSLVEDIKKLLIIKRKPKKF